MESSRSSSSIPSSYSSSEEFKSASNSGEGEKVTSVMSLVTDKLWQLTLGGQPTEEKPRTVSGFKTPRRDLVEEQFFTPHHSPRSLPTSSGEGESAAPSLQPSSPRPTADDRRKKFGGTKTPPQVFGLVLNKDAFAQKDPRTRAAIDKAYKEANEASDIESTAPILTPRSRSGGALITSAVQAAKRDTSFLDMIEVFRNESLRQKVSFSPESLMDPDYLFDIILTRINQRLKEGTQDSLKRVVQLLTFCIVWLDFNRETKLVAKAEKALEGIIQATKAPGITFVQKQSEVLERKLTTALENLASPYTVPAGHYGGKSQFSAMLEKIAQGTCKGKELKNFAKEAAFDLFQLQAELFCNITKDDLVKKWATSSELSEGIHKFRDADDALLTFILDRIIFERDASGRKHLMKFFMHLGYYSFKLHDLQSASCIYSALSHTLFEKLPVTTKEVYAHERYKARLC